jgi:predicted MFS family arabinose efflux permease
VKSVNMMASMGSNAFATWLGGQLMEQVSLDFPVYIGAGLYVLYGASYYLLFREMKGASDEQRLKKAS